MAQVKSKNNSARSQSGAVNGKPRRANQSSLNNSKFWFWCALITALAILISAISYFYINREKTIVELTVASGPYRSDSYELMEQIADVVSRQSDFLRLKIIPTKDSSQNIAILNKGNADLATIRSDTPVAANVRMIVDLFPDYFQIFARENSGVFRISELAGKKVAIPPFGTDEFRSFWAIADHYDIPITSVKWKATPFNEAVDQLLGDKIDAVFTVRSLRDRLVLNLFEDARLKRKNLRLIEIDQAEAIAVKRPFLKSLQIPKGAYSGTPATPTHDIISTSVTRTLVSREDIDPDTIAVLTRILFENRLDLVIRFALASAVQRPDIEKGTSVPLHEGAERYYNRDEPSFLQENAEPLALVITVLAMLFSGLLALRSRLNSSQKNRMDSYNYALLDIADQARKSKSQSKLKELKNDLYGILETVVRALDTDEVTEEGFQSFSLLWESVREVINDRRAELKT